MQYRIVGVDYFLNEMQPFEVEAILESADYIDSLEWDRTRLMMYSTLAPNSSKKLEISDILTFPWDKEKTGSESTDHSISNEDIERLRNKAKQYGSI